MSNGSAKERKNYFAFIAYLQIIGIILVVLGHSFHEYPDGSMGGSLLLYKMLYTFRMPLFMFVSGFLMAFTTSRKAKSWGEFAVTKFKRLLIPFLVLTLITFVPRSLMSGMADDKVDLSWHGLWLALSDPENHGMAYFWFIQSSFTLLLVVYGLMVLCRQVRVRPSVFYLSATVLIILLNVIPLTIPPYFSLYRTLKLAIYFIAGCAYSHWQTPIDNTIKWQSWVTFAILACLWICAYIMVDITHAPVFICSFLGIAMMISLAKILEYRHITILDHLQGSNYIIFLLSWYLNVASQQILHHFTDLPWWCYTILSLALGIYVPWLFYKWMCRHPHNRFTKTVALLLGQSLRPTK